MGSTKSILQPCRLPGTLVLLNRRLADVDNHQTFTMPPKDIPEHAAEQPALSSSSVLPMGICSVVEALRIWRITIYPSVTNRLCRRATDSVPQTRLGDLQSSRDPSQRSEARRKPSCERSPSRVNLSECLVYRWLRVSMFPYPLVLFVIIRPSSEDR